ncbi:MAG: acyl-CoA dehydrogenase family protein [Dehalococcoidia bacterium]
MDFELNEAQRLVRDTTRQFAAAEIAPHVLAREHDESFSIDVLRQMAAAGLLGGPIPEEYGGGGIDYLSYGLICEEIGKASPSVFTTALTVQISLVAQTILRWGTEEQKHDLLPTLCAGELIGAYALTEPNAGSDPAAMQTSARLDGDDWVLNGQKLWISNGAVADRIILFAQSDPALGHRGIGAFLVRGDTPGLTRTTIAGKMGLGASNTAQLFLDSVRVPKHDVLGEVGKGFTIAMSALDNGRYSTAACAVGIAQGCLDACVSYARQREQFGKPIGQHQLVQEMVADMAVEAEAARLLVWKVAALKDRGENASREVSMAKYYASEAAVRAARNAIQLHGGMGYVREYPVERYLRDAIALTLYEGTTQVQKLIIGRDTLGLAAFA